jgi:hypothetical protein
MTAAKGSNSEALADIDAGHEMAAKGSNSEALSDIDAGDETAAKGSTSEALADVDAGNEMAEKGGNSEALADIDAGEETAAKGKLSSNETGFVCPTQCSHCCAHSRRFATHKKLFKCLLHYGSWTPPHHECRKVEKRSKSDQFKTYCKFNEGEDAPLDTCDASVPWGLPKFEPDPSEVRGAYDVEFPKVSTWCRPRGTTGSGWCGRFPRSSCWSDYEQCGPRFLAHPWCKEKTMGRVATMGFELDLKCKEMTSRANDSAYGPTAAPYEFFNCPPRYEACNPTFVDQPR